MGIQEDALKRAMEKAPVSVRRLAKEAGLSEKLLRLIIAGKRSATPRTMKAVAQALERLRDRHDEAAGILRDHLDREEVDES